MPSDHFRAHARRPVSLSATLHATGRSWHADVSVIDLGLGGAGLVAHGGPVPYDAVTLELVSPILWDPLELPGQVRWSAPPDASGGIRVGVAFEHQRADRLRALLALVAGAAED
ncbi:MAG TPA: PilZ domain-containing protein [Polyangiaceae bacterium]|nr:PilZ domain-containing protein [Polyangiaceae bacterium]